MTRELFAIADVLCITTGRLISPRGIDAVYDIVGWMIKDRSVTTLGLLAHSAECKKAILNQYPELLDFVEAPAPIESYSSDELQEYYDRWIESVSREVSRKFYAIAQIDVQYKSDLRIWDDVKNKSVDYTK